MTKKVFVSGSFDPLHAGHVAFFQEAAKYGELYVGIGSDKSISAYKHPVFYSQKERLFIIKSIRFVKDVNVNTGMGGMDFEDNSFFKQCDILVLNDDQVAPIKEILCRRLNKEYIVLKRKPAKGMPKRTSTEIRKLILKPQNMKTRNVSPKFRIVEETDGTGKKTFCVQQRFLFWWNYWIQGYSDESRTQYNSPEDAEAAIKIYKNAIVSKKIVKEL